MQSTELKEYEGEPLTIFLIAENNLEELSLSLKSIRLFNEIEHLSVVLIDNCSTDGTDCWAKDQKDITYVRFEDERKGYVTLLQETAATLSVEGNILLMHANYGITYHTLLRMKVCLYLEDDIEVVGGLFRANNFFQRLDDELDTYEKAFAYAEQLQGIPVSEALELLGPILIKHVESLSLFDQKFTGYNWAQSDFSIQLIHSEKKQVFCHSAVFWNFKNGVEFDDAVPYSDRVSDLQYLKSKWQMNYFNLHCNPNIVTLLKMNAKDESTVQDMNILEVGCDCGATLLEIKNSFPNANLYGTDIMEEPLCIASHFVQTAKNNIEEKKIPFAVKFDYIIMGDVLEHLHNPEATLEYCKSLLKENGRIIASIPNVQHISVVEELLKGNFTYADTGLLDKTHIHFFTWNEIIRMANRIDLNIDFSYPVCVGISEKQENLIDALLKLVSESEKYMYETFQYLVLFSRNKKNKSGKK